MATKSESRIIDWVRSVELSLVVGIFLALHSSAYAGDGNRLVKTFSDGGRQFSKHELVGSCKLEEGTTLPCASNWINDNFSVKYAGYWFSPTQESFLYKTSRGEVAKFTEDKIRQCSGKLRVDDGEYNIVYGHEGICLIDKEEAKKLLKLCKIDQICTVHGYFNQEPTCGVECSEMIYVTSVQNR